MSDKLAKIANLMSFKTIIGLIFWAAGTTVLLMLWQWQMERLVWKENLLSMLEREEAREELPLVAGETVKTDRPQDLILKKFKAVPAAETIETDLLIFVGPRPKDGEEGAHLYAPLPVQDSNITLLAHLGWVAKAQQDEVKKALADTSWPAEVTGYFIPEHDSGIGNVKNFPDDNIWLRPDIKDFSDYYGLNVMTPGDLDIFDDKRATPPLFYYVETQIAEEIEPQLYKNIELRNDHAYYAQFWLTLAFFWTIIFILAALWPTVKESLPARKKK